MLVHLEAISPHPAIRTWNNKLACLIVRECTSPTPRPSVRPSAYDHLSVCVFILAPARPHVRSSVCVRPFVRVFIIDQLTKRIPPLAFQSSAVYLSVYYGHFREARLDYKNTTRKLKSEVV